MKTAPDQPPKPLSEQARAQAETVLQAAREELTRADGKASLLLASTGVVIGALLAALLAGSWQPSDISNGIEWLWWLGVAAAAAAVGCLGKAVYPNTNYRGSTPDVIAFFGDVTATPETQLRERLEHAVTRDADAALLDQLSAVSSIVDTKYWHTKTAIWLLAVGSALCALAVLLDLVV